MGSFNYRAGTIKLWNTSYRWSARFEVRQNYQVENPTASSLQIHHQNELYTHLPIRIATTTDFWAAMIEISGLWPMDLIMLHLSNAENNVDYAIQADDSGNLVLSLAQFYELLPPSEYYLLSYQIPGYPSQRLIEVSQSCEPLKPFTGLTGATSKPITGERSQTSNWHFVTLKPRKRDLFTILLKRQMDNNISEKTGILAFKECSPDYPDYLLVQIQNSKLARQTLQGVEGFGDLQSKPLTEAQVNRMEA